MLKGIKKARFSIKLRFDGQLFSFNAREQQNNQAFQRQIKLLQHVFYDINDQSAQNFFFDDILHHFKAMNTAVQNNCLNMWSIKLVEIINTVFIDPDTKCLRDDLGEGIRADNIANFKKHCFSFKLPADTLENILCQGYLALCLNYLTKQHPQLDIKQIHQYILGVNFCLPESYLNLKMKYLIANLKLNISRSDDLTYWQGECMQFLGTGGVSVTNPSNKESFQVPTVVAELISGVGNNDQSYNTLTHFINTTRSKRSNNWINQKTRGDNVKLLYDTSKDIENMNFNQANNMIK